MPHPAAPRCLTKPYSRNPGQKGGTVIREDVLNMEEHRRLMTSPDGYRPDACPGCNHGVMHAHSERERWLRSYPESRKEWFRRYLCPKCTAIWTVLAGFMARHLHRIWTTVERAMVGDGELVAKGVELRVDVPKRTRQRWVARLRCAAAVVVHALAGSLAIDERRSADLAGMTRVEVVEALTSAGLLARPHRLGMLAGWLHRLVPGVRLM